MTDAKAEGGGDLSPLKDEVEGLYEGAKELEAAPDAPAGAPPPRTPLLGDSIPGGSALSALLNAAPFTEYVHYAARNRYGHVTINGRVALYEKDHPWVARYCVAADMFLRTLVTFLILAVLVVVIYKALAPIGFETPPANPSP
ncbi:hypothetical protein [Mycolicibacterium cosmeticum]|uniref:hypothetical protein n=1 Tax=Mycolicibacterium cosmeticum TaxID=258533 RepID=UPI0032046B91